MTEKMDGFSMDIELDAREKLRAIFPECFVEGKLDLVKLESLCGEFPTVDENDRERYEFRWKGKSDALKLAQQRSLGCLRPAKSESVEWDTTKNVYIEGDNLEVLKLLQRSYFRKVKMIYIDPPYNTGNDFVYEDDFADSLENYKKITSQGTTSNPETAGRYHTNWLNMMYPRLRLAKNLLRDDGVIFISIDDNEVHNLRKLCDEVFGEENFIAQITIASNSAKNNSKYVSVTHEYVLCYARSKSQLGKDWSVSRNYVYEFKKRAAMLQKSNLSDSDIRKELLTLVKYPRFYEFDHYTYIDNRGAFRASDLTAPSSKNFYDVIHPETKKPCKTGIRGWAYSQEGMQELIGNNLILWGKDETIMPQLKNYLDENQRTLPKSTLFFDSQSSTKWLKSEELPFDFAKPIELIKYVLETCTSNTDIILDFFSGSATTAHAVMQLNAEDGGNRRFIMVQLPELLDEKSEAYKAGYRTICDIGKTRIMKAGAKIKSEQDGQIKLGEDEKLPLDIGFRVFKLDTSNLKIWDNSPTSDEEEAFQRMMNMLDVLKPDRCEEDVVYEVLLKLGQELTEDVIPLDINGKAGVYAIHKEVVFMVCLARGVTAEDAEKMAEYMPGRIIFADECFNNSVEKANVYHTLKNHGITIKVL